VKRVPPECVDDYLAGLPADARAALERLRKIIKSAAPSAADYAVGKGRIRFATGEPLPAARVKKLVRARIAENEKRATE